MDALLIIDAQNEFSPEGKRAVEQFHDTILIINNQVELFRKSNKPVVWVRHYNKPHEGDAFVPGTWGAEFYNGMGPAAEYSEREFTKNVYGAFTGTDIDTWLKTLRIRSVLITGFYTFGCVSTTAREAIMAGYEVWVSLRGTASCELTHPVLGCQSADEVRTAALLHIAAMGARLITE